jgi:hypothetical protein
VQRHDDFVAVHHVSDGRRIERPLVQRGHGAVLRRVVDEHERLRVVGLVEEVGDALFLHEPRDEREVRLVVLHAVLAHRVRLLELQQHGAFVRLKAGLEHFPQHVRDGLVLEDARVAALPEPEERGANRHHGPDAVRSGGPRRDMRHDSRHAVLDHAALHDEGAVLAEELVRVGAQLAGEQVNHGRVGSAQRLADPRLGDHPRRVERVALEDVCWPLRLLRRANDLL